MDSQECFTKPEIGENGLKTMLVPTDFSESSNLALRTAIDLAQQQNARIYPLHVVSSRQAANEKEMMQRQPAKFPKATSVEIVQDIRRGKPYEEILKAQTEKNIDLIVIAPHTKTALYTLFGSVTEKVKRKARCSVLVVGV